MANRDAKLIERTLKDFSLGAMSGGTGGSSEILTNYDMFKALEYKDGEELYFELTKLKALLENAGVDMQRRIELTGNQNEYIGFNICDSMITMLICKHVEAYVWLNLEVFGQTIFNEKELPDYNTLNEIFDYLITLQDEEQPLEPLDIIHLIGADIQALTFVEDRHHYQQEPYYYNVYKVTKEDWNSLWKRVIIEPFVLNMKCHEEYEGRINAVEINHTLNEIYDEWCVRPNNITVNKYWTDGSLYGTTTITNIVPLEAGGYNIIELANAWVHDDTRIRFDSTTQEFEYYLDNPD